jgi:membrane protease YdiL (CAAX protease family)
VIALQEAAEAAGPEHAWVGLVMLAGGLTLTPLAVLAARSLVPERRVFFARWRFLHLFAVLLVAIGVAVLAGLGFGSLDLGLDDVLASQIATAIGLAAACAAIVQAAKVLDPDGLQCLGLARTGNARAVAAGIAAYAICAPALLGCMLLWPWLFERLGGTYALQPIVTKVAELGPAELVWLFALAVLVQPLLEELVFRAFMQPLFVQNLGDRGGVALTSLFFAALHGPSAFLPVFGLSLVLGALMLRTQRLLAVAVVHALHNGLTLLIVILGAHAGQATGVDAPTAGALALALLAP